MCPSMRITHTWECLQVFRTSSAFVVCAGFAVTRTHSCRASPLAEKFKPISRHFVLVSVVFLAMAGWQYKLMNELDRERARSTVGWSKCGPTAAGRLALMLDGTIPLHEGIYISTSPCVAFKWRGAEIMEDPLSLLLVRNDAKAGGVTRWMIARPIGSLAFTVDATRVEEALVRIKVLWLSGELLLEHEYQADTAMSTIVADVKAALDTMNKYTDWDLNTVSLAHGDKASGQSDLWRLSSAAKAKAMDWAAARARSSSGLHAASARAQHLPHLSLLTAECSQIADTFF